MLAALCRYDLRIPGCSSLKEKRHVVKTLTASLRQRFNVSVAEVDHHDLWQRATLGLAVVSTENAHVSELLQGVRSIIESRPDAEVLDWQEQRL